MFQKSISTLALVLFCVLCESVATAQTDAEVCSAFASLSDKSKPKLFSDVGRELSTAEQKHLEAQKLELIEFVDYVSGARIVDIDNDGIDDWVVWNIQGTGRFNFVEIYDGTSSKPLKRKFRIQIGALFEAQFAKFGRKNYLLSSKGEEILEFVKFAGELRAKTVCSTRVTVSSQTRCRHPACLEIAKDAQSIGSNVLWPHRYFGDAGLNVYFNGDHNLAIKTDFDNSGEESFVWKLGRKGYIYQHVYWGLIGLGEKQDVEPYVDPKLNDRPTSEDSQKRKVISGKAHDRLRYTLEQQSLVLSKATGKSIKLPEVGEFFFFGANNGRTYWAWDFGKPPLGEDIYITYTKGKKSDYIGKVSLVRRTVLEPCTKNCIQKSE